MTLSTKTTSQKATSWPGLFIKSMFAFLLIVSLNASAEINTVPGMPGPISGQTNVCAFVGTSQVVTYNIDPVAGAALYLWSVPPTATLVSGQGTTSIQLTFSNAFTAAANKQLRVRAISQDGNSPDRILYLVSQQPLTPNAINGPTNACIYIGTPNQATYTTSRDAAASGYIWGSDPLATIVTHPNGPGVNDTVIRVLFRNGYKTSSITVQSTNHCGFSSARILNVSGSAPSTPGIITGPTNACAYMLPNGVVATYSINPVAGATSYTWITPANCIVNHPNGAGATDVTITVQYPSDFTSGSVSVIASSGCDDSSPRSLAITKLNPGTPGVITPLQKELCPDRAYSYTLPSMPSNTTSVTWTVPLESISVTGQGNASIIVQYPEGHVNGIVTATGVSNCASSATRTLPVVLSRCQVERMGGSTGRNANRGNKGNETQNATGNEQDNKNSLGETEVQEQSNSTDEMKVNIAPNPAKGNFKLQVFTIKKDIIKIKLLDLQGRELKKMNILQGESLNFGNDLKPGTYIIEVSQGKVKKTQKILKL